MPTTNATAAPPVEDAGRGTPTTIVIYSPKAPQQHVAYRTREPDERAEEPPHAFWEFHNAEFRTTDPAVADRVMKASNNQAPLFRAVVEGDGFRCDVCGRALYHAGIAQIHFRECARKQALKEDADGNRIDLMEGFGW